MFSSSRSLGTHSSLFEPPDNGNLVDLCREGKPQICVLNRGIARKDGLSA